MKDAETKNYAFDEHRGTDGDAGMDASLTATPSPNGTATPDALFHQARALAEAADWPALQALLADLPDAGVEPRLWPLLVQLGRALPDPTAIKRAVALAMRANQPPSPRILLIMRLMEDRSASGTADAWRVFRAEPALCETPSAPNALRCLARLRLRLPEGAERQEAGATLARYRDRFPDAEELLVLEVHEALVLLAAVGNWSAICDLAAATPDHRLHGDAALQLLSAALELQRPDEARRALALMQPDLQRPPRRLWIARRLARAGMVEEAWALLDMPALAEAEAAIRLSLLEVLQILLQSGGGLKRAIQARITQLLAPPLAPVARLPFAATPGHHRPPPQPAALFAAPGITADQLAVFTRLLQQSRQSVEGPEAKGDARWPDLLVFEDVSVSDTGQIWDAAGQLAPLLHVPTLRGLPPAPPGAAYFAAAAVATETPRNFFHWFAEGFPALAWRLRPDAPQVPVLIREAVAPLARQTLALLDDPLPLVVIREPVRVGRAFASRRGFETLFHWDCFGPLYDVLVERALRQAPSLGTGKRLYLSRRDVARRGMANEPAVEAALAKLGFSIVSFGGRSLAEQIRMVHEADILVSPHGAGLAHLAAARPGLKVFEFMPVLAGTEALRCCYLRLSAIRGHRHALWLETVQRKTDHWQVDLDTMLPALLGFLEEMPGQ